MAGRRVLQERALLLLGGLLVGLVVGEAVAWGVSRYRWGEGYRAIAAAKAEASRALPRAPNADPREPELPADNLPRRLHPYFGFTYQANLKTPIRTNNMGFVEEVDFPYQPDSSELVVGVFGGSLALDLRHAEPRRVLREGILSLAQARGYRKVRILMMAQGGWRQPQTTFCFLYYRPWLDLAIFVDGFNEISPMDRFANRGGYPPDFPALTVFGPLISRGDLVRNAAIAEEIAAIRARQLAWTRTASRRPWGRSMLVHAAWRAAMGWAERQAQSLQQELWVAPAPEAPHPENPEDRRRYLIDRFGAYTEIAVEAGRAAGVPVAQFLQPNQYFSGSKPLSDVEKSIALKRMETAGPLVDDAYPRLRDLSRRLRERGIPSYDLTMIFENTEETLYQDSCCHLNERGMSLLAEEIVASIGSASLVDRIPVPDERASGRWGRLVNPRGETPNKQGFQTRTLAP